MCTFGLVVGEMWAFRAHVAGDNITQNAHKRTQKNGLTPVSVSILLSIISFGFTTVSIVSFIVRKDVSGAFVP